MEPTWMGDTGFDDALLHRWRAAEAWCGFKENTAKAKQSKADDVMIMPPLPPNVSFVPCINFIASAESWVFQKCTDDMDSLSYYREHVAAVATHLILRVVISIAFHNPLATCNPTLLMQTAPTPWTNAAQSSKQARRARMPNGAR